MQHKRIPMVTGLFFIGALACGDDDKGTPSTKASCANICVLSEKAACPNDPSDCDSSCQDTFEGSPARCDSQRDELLSCASRAEFTCDADGESVALSCTAKVTAYTKCLGTTGTAADAGGTVNRDAGSGGTRDAGVDAGAADAGGGTDSGVTVSAEFKALCAAQCRTVLATGCANDGTQATCVATCEDAVASYGGTCTAEVKAAVTCFRDASYVCDTSSGTAGTTVCNPQTTALDACGSGTTPVTCDLPSNPTACQTCIATNCCAEREACGADCLSLDTCYANCATGNNACLDACDSAASTAAYNALNDLYTCFDDQCPSSCM